MKNFLSKLINNFCLQSVIIAISHDPLFITGDGLQLSQIPQNDFVHS